MPRTRVNLLPYPEHITEFPISREPPIPVVQQPGKYSLTYNTWFNEYEEHLRMMYGEVRKIITDRHPSLNPRDAYPEFCKLVYYSSSGHQNTV